MAVPKTPVALCLVAFGLMALPAAATVEPPQAIRAGEEVLRTDNPVGGYGGKLVAALRPEPKTLNPVIAIDASSFDVIRRLSADLIHINRLSQRTEPALAKSWSVSADGRRYTLRLRQGIRFSDGQPFDADDVLFTFHLLLDEKIHAPQRDLLVVAGKPIQVRKIDSHTLTFELAEPDAAAERLFDSIAILPRHLLEKAYGEGKLNESWNLGSSPAQMAGLGPFRLKEYVPGQYIRLERNPYYWKVDRQGNRLPYLDEIVFVFVANEQAEVIRFQSGETDVISRLGASNFSILAKEEGARGYRLYDLGSGLEYDFLFFNLNDLSSKNLPEIARGQDWFCNVSFRQAVSAAIDREGIVRLVYQGRATPLWGHVTAGNKLWVDRSIPHPARSLDRSRDLLKSAGFSWKEDGALADPRGKLVEFSILTSASNEARTRMGAIIQDDLSHLGMKVHALPMEFRALTDRVFRTFDYEASVFGLVSGDADPNPEMNVWLSNGATHLWNLSQRDPAAPWETEVDRLMHQQQATRVPEERKRLYNRVQQLVAENLPLICLVSPNILVGAKKSIGNFEPVVLGDYTLWNVEKLFIRPEGSGKK